MQHAREYESKNLQILDLLWRKITGLMENMKLLVNYFTALKVQKVHLFLNVWTIYPVKDKTWTIQISTYARATYVWYIWLAELLVKRIDVSLLHLSFCLATRYQHRTGHVTFLYPFGLCDQWWRKFSHGQLCSLLRSVTRVHYYVSLLVRQTWGSCYNTWPLFGPNVQRSTMCSSETVSYSTTLGLLIRSEWHRIPGRLFGQGGHLHIDKQTTTKIIENPAELQFCSNASFFAIRDTLVWLHSKDVEVVSHFPIQYWLLCVCYTLFFRRKAGLPTRR